MASPAACTSLGAPCPSWRPGAARDDARRPSTAPTTYVAGPQEGGGRGRGVHVCVAGEVGGQAVGCEVGAVPAHRLHDEGEQKLLAGRGQVQAVAEEGFPGSVRARRLERGEAPLCDKVAYPGTHLRSVVPYQLLFSQR